MGGGVGGGGASSQHCKELTRKWLQQPTKNIVLYGLKQFIRGEGEGAAKNHRYTLLERELRFMRLVKNRHESIEIINTQQEPQHIGLSLDFIFAPVHNRPPRPNNNPCQEKDVSVEVDTGPVPESFLEAEEEESNSEVFARPHPDEPAYTPPDRPGSARTAGFLAD